MIRKVLLCGGIVAAISCCAAGVALAGATRATAAELTVIYAQRVTPSLAPPPDEQHFYASLANALLQQQSPAAAQYVLLVDRNVNVQAIFLFWAAAGAEPLLIGAAPVSTGKVGQYDHFETPTGVFEHVTDNPDFRAEGTKNAFGIRGYGAKGMRVFDFGWQQALRGWGNGGISTMRLQMHATDPDVLESRLGTAQSKGCIRIPATLNRLLDEFGVIDADYQAARDNGRHIPVPMPQPRADDAGRYLLVIDSERQQRPAWAAVPDAAATP